jgi:hypothetical protein
MGWMRGAAVAVLVMLGGPSFAADAGEKVYGYYNPATHAFTPAPTGATATAAASVVRSGTLTIKVRAKLDAIPAGQKVTAYVSAYVDDTSYQNGIGTQVPMSRAGDTATASVTVPYIFTVTSASEKITVSVQVVTQIAPFPSTMLSTEIPLPTNNADTVVNLPQTL